MKLSNIKRVYLLGGGGALVGFARELVSRCYEVYIFTSPRHSTEIMESGKTFAAEIKDMGLNIHMPEDVNTDFIFLDCLTEETMGVGFGEVWTFNKETIELFNGKLFDFMGIRLPQYRGGAHYTWQILRGSRIGGCNLQVINEFMVQGEFDSGEVILSKEYLFPISARIPQDYFDAAHIEELLFLSGLLDMIENGKEFHPTPIAEAFSIYFPRLNTLKQGWIDWSWNNSEIASFINAFDEPYPGASTELNGHVVRIKSITEESMDGSFHPFCAGLVYKINSTGVYVATRDGTIIIGRVLDESGGDVTRAVRAGQRFFTPVSRVEAAMRFHAEYDANGEK